MKNANQGEKCTYNNPIMPGFYPDPSVCRVGEDFYLVTSTFAYFPGVPIFQSRDLSELETDWQCAGPPFAIKSSGSRPFTGDIRSNASVS